MITLSLTDLLLAASLIVILAGISWYQKLGLATQITIAAIRTVVQLLLIGLVLKILFASPNPWLLALVATIMLLAASREVLARQKYPFKDA